MAELHHFLLVYDVRRGELRSHVSFDDADEAVAAYSALEREHMGDREIQIVLVSSDSIETVQSTHGNLFRRVGLDEMVEGDADLRRALSGD